MGVKARLSAAVLPLAAEQIPQRVQRLYTLLVVARQPVVLIATLMARQIPERAVVGFAVVRAIADKVRQRRPDILATRSAQPYKPTVQGTLLRAEKVSGRQEPPPVAVVAVRGAGSIRVVPAERVYIRLMNRVVRRPVRERLTVWQQEPENKVSVVITSALLLGKPPVAKTDKAAQPLAQTMAQNTQGGYEIAQGTVSCNRASVRATRSTAACSSAEQRVAIRRAFGNPPLQRRPQKPLRQTVVAA